MSAKKKSKTWYGFKTPRESLRIMEVKVIKETPTRIYLADDEQRDAMWRTKWLNKMSSYEWWFPTREEAVKKKLAMLKRQVKSASEITDKAKACVKLFKAQENA